MSDVIIAAMITGLCAIIGQFFISKRNSEDLYARLDKQSELADQKIHGEIDVIKTEIVNLKSEVQKHNGVIERTYKLEQDSAVHTTELETNGREIKELKEKVHDLERR